jgi:hypothetical protein
MHLALINRCFYALISLSYLALLFSACALSFVRFCERDLRIQCLVFISLKLLKLLKVLMLLFAQLVSFRGDRDAMFAFHSSYLILKEYVC